MPESKKNDNNKKAKKTNELNIDIKNMGVDIDKNEYREIVLSQSNHPDKNFYRNYL